MEKQELRAIEFDQLEVRTDEKAGKLIRGHGAVYNKLSVDLGNFREMFDTGAFTETISKDDIRSLRDHNPSFILGRNKARTLTLREDEKGVLYEVIPPDTSYARDLMVSIERRDVTGGSIIFNIDEKGERWVVDGKEVDPMEAFMAMWSEKKRNVERHITKARLYDIGPVTFPAYPQTDVKVRSIIAIAECQPSLIARAIEEMSDEERNLFAKLSKKISVIPDKLESERTKESLETYKRKISIASL